VTTYASYGPSVEFLANVWASRFSENFGAEALAPTEYEIQSRFSNV